MSAPRRALLDTSVVIDLERLDLGAFAEIRPSVSAVTLAELAYGLNTPDPVERLVRTERYYATLDQFEVFPFDIPAAKLYGTLAELVRQAGRNPRPRRLDLQIAATAAAHSLPLLTRNPADFADLDRLLEVVPL
ncbi:type II toxin-antitoxin system VapC family toxin [Allokutzneria sp. A3M-2-11 16]|uniref:type II toxin-antitoxin system VapC family toxin n=1 Tax=Allokutzneria sp. A3M-2-11 16 TaxID=2962043 RepID=UPI0020B848F5|nr:type II toxin-antitoxin system VapC family toxin [Allokutzneria sp. A3M-2-11 16]MCP3798154.1 type II toxin-antitoxin system VapC family toxin [Allokutzneria sp. A3M-2-11 16]